MALLDRLTLMSLLQIQTSLLYLSSCTLRWLVSGSRHPYLASPLMPVKSLMVAVLSVGGISYAESVTLFIPTSYPNVSI